MSLATSSSVDPLGPWKTWSITIKNIRCETPGVFTIEVAFDDAQAEKDYDYRPGQFNMLYMPGVGEAAISISGQTQSGYLQHTIRSVGNVTAAICSAGKGCSLGLRGPFGTSWPVGSDAMQGRNGKNDIIIAAGGIGLAPLRSLIRFAIAQRDAYRSVAVLIGARKPEDLLYAAELPDWRQHAITVEATVDRPQNGWKGHVGVVTLLLDRVAISNPESTQVMTCGPEVMMRYIAKSAMQRGIPEENIWVTLERNMNCAIGLCGHCQIGPKFVCRDGPVFRYDAVSAWLRVQEL